MNRNEAWASFVGALIRQRDSDYPLTDPELTRIVGQADKLLAEYDRRFLRRPRSSAALHMDVPREYGGKVFTPMQMRTATPGSDAWLAAGSQGRDAKSPDLID